MEAQIKLANDELDCAKRDMKKIEKKYEVVVVDSDSESDEGNGGATGTVGHRPVVHHTVASDALNVAKCRVKAAENCVAFASRSMKAWSDTVKSAKSHAKKARSQKASAKKELSRAKALLPYTVTVKSLSGRSVVVDVALSRDTIGSVKSQVREEGISLDNQHLMYGGVSLLDSRTFAFYNIPRDVTLYLVPRSFGPTQCSNVFGVCMEVIWNSSARVYCSGWRGTAPLGRIEVCSWTAFLRFPA